jgi:hypothetical protein
MKVVAIAVFFLNSNVYKHMFIPFITSIDICRYVRHNDERDIKHIALNNSMENVT